LLCPKQSTTTYLKLSTKIIATITVFFVAAMAVSGVAVYQSIKTSLQTSTSLNQVQATVRTLDQVDRYLYERSLDIQTMSQNQQLRSGTSAQSAKVIAPDLATLLTFNNAWSTLAVIDTKGQTVAATNPTEAKSTTTAQRAQVLGLGALYKQALAGKVAHSDLVKSPATGQPTIVYFAPLYNASRTQVVSVLAGEIAWSHVREILKNIKLANVTLVNKDGFELGSNSDNTSDILADNVSKTEAFRKAAATESGSDVVPGIEQISGPTVTSYAHEAGFQTYPGNDWRLIVATPTSAVLAPAQRITTGLAIAFAAIMLVGLTLVLLFMRRQVVTPIRTLSSAVHAVTMGDLSQRVHSRSKDELGQLATSFNQMTVQLASTTNLLQEEKVRLESSIDSLPLGFIMTDASNVIVSMNPAIQVMLGLKSDGDKDQLDKMLAQSTSLLEQLLEKSQDCLKKLKPINVPELSDKGRIFRVFFSPVMVKESQPAHAIGVAILVEDVTEDRILARSKDEFFSIASHELRTPLTAIRGNTKMIQDYYPEQLKDTNLSEMVSDIHDSSIRLIEIVNDFLDASRLEQGKMQFSIDEFSLEEVIEKITYELGGLSKEKGVFIRMTNDLATLPLVKADKNKVKQVIYNLVGNALKFVDKGGVTITAAVQKNFMKISIIDTGKGISPENQQILFHKFQQAETSILTRDTTRGTGLGLYISKLLIERMGGHIGLEKSEVGKGSTFTFTIPLAKTKPAKKS
jgi:signal transduction histidine kinase